MEEFDIKKVEEQTAELEKNLIVKELETLDVLEELSTTKKIVEELKYQLQKESMKHCIKTPISQTTPTPPVIKEMNKEHQRDSLGFCPSPVSSPDLILMELKQAKLNLGKTINDLGAIQSSVESLNKKMKKEKNRVSMENLRFQGEKFKKMAENISRSMMGSGENNFLSMKTAEMRWVAAKKLEEAAKAAEALAMAEIRAFSGDNHSSEVGFVLPEPDRKVDFENNCPNNRNGNSKFKIMKMMEEALSEVKESKSALEEALGRVEVANRKQIAAGEALRRSCATPAPDYSPYNKINVFQPSDEHHYHHPHHHGHGYHHSPILNETIKPVLRPTVSMRDVLSTKQNEGQNGNNTNERQKVALSQMLQELREDFTFPKKPEMDHQKFQNNDQSKQFFTTQRRKFGLIHISLPLTRQSKKKAQGLN